MNVNLGNYIFNDLEKNPYLIKIYHSLINAYASKIVNNQSEFPSINLSDALRFADLLSKSTDDEKSEFHKQLAQEIVTLIRELFPECDEAKAYLGSVLSNNGNYPGIAQNIGDYSNADTLDRLDETFLREQCKVPGEKNLVFSRIQKEAFSHFEDQSYSFSGPTSMGKSFLILQFIKKKIREGCGNNFVFLVPTNALIHELSEELHNNLKTLLGLNKYRIVSVTESILLSLKDNHFIFVLTPERLLYLLMNHQDLRIDYLFIDEAHKMISCDGRSGFYYKVIDFIMKRKYIQKPKVIFSSPNIPNADLFQETITDSNISLKSESMNLSPVNQFKFLIDFRNNEFKAYSSVDNSLIDIDHLSNCSSLNELIKKQSNILDKDKSKRHKTIVYCSSVSKAITYANSFYESLPSVADDEVPNELKSFSEELHDEISEHYFLVKYVKKGVAYHVGYLPNKTRVKLESLFRENDICVIFCTSTLIEGVNFPAKNLIITDYMSGNSKLSLIDFKNLMGRVGRIQYNLFGNIFLVNNQENNKLVKNFTNMLVGKVDRQKLSIDTGLKDSDKKFIVDLLCRGETSFKPKESRKDQKLAEYELMQKITNILIHDILCENDSLVMRKFEPFIKNKKQEIVDAFKDKTATVGDDINISTDQVSSLQDKIRNHQLKYPIYDPNDPDLYDNIVKMLEDFCDAFKWDEVDSDWIGRRNSDGTHPTFKYYATLLLQWINGKGINFITKNSIAYYEKRVNVAWVKVDGFKMEQYNGTPLHKNYAIANTLDTIENVILFHINNYCLKFTQEYKAIFPDDENFEDWQTYIECGSANNKVIFLQRAGLSRETTLYLRDNDLICLTSNKKSLWIKEEVFSCPNSSVKEECELLKINVPELFNKR